ncbi:MAG: hypothetical protein ACFCU6_00825 [Balneolaceae bacterium]
MNTEIRKTIASLAMITAFFLGAVILAVFAFHPVRWEGSLILAACIAGLLIGVPKRSRMRIMSGFMLLASMFGVIVFVSAIATDFLDDILNLELMFVEIRASFIIILSYMLLAGLLYGFSIFSK